ncbi:MAG: ABC transporter ATP-binding protein [Defluviitaleaceae bacterium]|nr:ABC transporter ATP-binding protein [Defluviitaleaceae bacterium]
MNPVIEVEKLSKSYAQTKAVHDVSISVCRGEVFGLLGANGAGKSTTIECILGTKKQDSGTVKILGMNPLADRKRLFEKVGVQFQESNYQSSITVRELCKVTGSLYKAPTNYNDLLKRFGIFEKAKSKVADLSRGQKQRLFIVLALIPNPEVVFLDELTTGLDSRARRDVWKCLEELKANGLTIFLTSHFMDEVEILCDRIMILKKGAIIFHGTALEAINASPHDKLEDAYLWFTDDPGHSADAELLGQAAREVENENI